MKEASGFGDIAQSYLSSGLCVLPASRSTKSPRVGKWSVFKKRLPTQTEVDAWFANEHDAVCVVCGEVSGNLELLDFDDKAGLFDAWKKKIPQQLFDRLVIESTQSGGKHVFYRCEVPVCGNIKLAQKRIDLSDEEIIPHKGKEYVWHNDKKYQVSVDEDGVMYFVVTQIETRGEGGLFLCAPTDGYEIVQGDFENIPVISEAQRTSLLTAAWELNSHVPETIQVYDEESPKKATVENGGTRPGDAFNIEGDLRGILHNHGWTLITSSNGNEYWRRPGKESKSWSASYSADKGVFYVFSSNAQPFEQGKGYSPFSVYAMLEHNGDYSAAASKLHSIGYGTLPGNDADNGVDISKIVDSSKAEGEVIYENPEGRGVTKMTEGLSEDIPPELRRPVIRGLLRDGETMNLIAAPKTGKSWLACDLALAIARGEKWLDVFDCVQGRVLLLDNELHTETLQWRFHTVRKARGVTLASIDEYFYKMLPRGDIEDLHMLSGFFKTIQPGFFKVIILDAFYRFLPRGCDENDNASIAYLYNSLDRYAKQLKCSFILVHHTSKGIQGSKAITDVGAGAGSQSRATDTHVILRPHQQENVIVLDAAVRSNPPLSPMCLRWKFPVWKYEPGLDPGDIEGAKLESRKISNQYDSKQNPNLSIETFLDIFIEGPPVSKKEVYARAEQIGLSRRQVEGFIENALAQNVIFRVQEAANKPLFYSRNPPRNEA